MFLRLELVTSPSGLIPNRDGGIFICTRFSTSPSAQIFLTGPNFGPSAQIFAHQKSRPKFGPNWAQKKTLILYCYYKPVTSIHEFAPKSSQVAYLSKYYLPWLCTLVSPPPALLPVQESCFSKRISLGDLSKKWLSKCGGGN